MAVPPADVLPLAHASDYQPKRLANRRLLEQVMSHRELARKDPLVLFPWLLRPCRARRALRGSPAASRTSASTIRRTSRRTCTTSSGCSGSRRRSATPPPIRPAAARPTASPTATGRAQPVHDVQEGRVVRDGRSRRLGPGALRLGRPRPVDAAVELHRGRGPGQGRGQHERPAPQRHQPGGPRRGNAVRRRPATRRGRRSSSRSGPSRPPWPTRSARSAPTTATAPTSAASSATRRGTTS